ncbi:MAG: OadG family protein [Ruminiclostridium sp.]|nr:OadG family protein [Ruminiclostridium sp.]
MLYNIFDLRFLKLPLFYQKVIIKELNTLINLMSLSAEATDVAAVAETVKDEILVEGNWELIGSTVVTGVVIVFLILAILIFFLWAMGKIFQAVGNAKKKKTEENALVIAVAPAVSESQTDEAEIYEESDDDEIIAVISAAIAAYGEAEGKQYRICGIKKREKSQRSGWSAAGIAENTRSF